MGRELDATDRRRLRELEQVMRHLGNADDDLRLAANILGEGPATPDIQKAREAIEMSMHMAVVESDHIEGMQG
ncbi:hypothetical protein [Promicromonospora panici]|uniref:hypothetical protein n=1 Tax=Promicromonospora panici TaxID=2219658 RepID=UPI00101BF1B1|nr:hypothetical protein [Promicromonospora panici]